MSDQILKLETSWIAKDPSLFQKGQCSICEDVEADEINKK